MFSGHITLIGDEPHLPYHRPPLSKERFIRSCNIEANDEASLTIKPRQLYEDKDIDLIYGNKAINIDTEAKTVSLQDGQHLEWQSLVFATGSRARPLDVINQPIDGVFNLRTIDDIEAIHKSFNTVEDLVIIGGGYIGLEVAAAAIVAGKNVTVLEHHPRVLQRAVAPQLSEFYEDIHKIHGVNIECNTKVTGITQHNGAVTGVMTQNSKYYAAQMVIVGIGVLPNDMLARDAGILCTNGIDVDSYCRSSHKDIFALGDCGNFTSLLYERKLRIESVPNTNAQAAALAKTLCNSPTEHVQLPWFWSNQYNLKLKMAGITEGYDETVIRGDIEQHSFTVFYLRNKRLIAAHSINRPADFMGAKRLIAEKAQPCVKHLAEPSYAIKDF
jgi:3-phenylpropionate/trans-cinnamate dioxygenase ferredoxin reductase subunit